MRTRVTASFFVMLLSLLFVGSAWASFTVPPRPSGPVYDGANVLTAEQETALEHKLIAFRDAQGPSVVVAFVQTLDGGPINESTYEVFSKWGIGSKERNDGVLLLISVAEARKAGPGASKCGCARIEVGAYLEGTLTDARSLKILKEYVLASAVNGNFDRAANDAVDSIFGVLSKDPEALKATDESPGGGAASIIFFTILAGIFIVIVVAVAMNGGGGGGGYYGGGGSSWGGGGSSSGGGSSGGSSWGGGGSFGGGGSGGGGASI